MSEQLSPKAIIAESIIENFEAVSSYVARQSLRDMLDENQALRAENARLKEALQGMLQLVDDGLLVRNTANDNMTGWGILALPIVRAVQRANEALQPKRGKP